MIDFRWQESLHKSKIVEESRFMGYKTILITLSEMIGSFHYPYRMLFFKDGIKNPIFILNLEISIFGTCALGAHTSSLHINYGTNENPNMKIEDFKKWAYPCVTKLINELNNKEKNNDIKKKQNKIKNENKIFLNNWSILNELKISLFTIIGFIITIINPLSWIAYITIYKIGKSTYGDKSIVKRFSQWSAFVVATITYMCLIVYIIYRSNS